MKQNQYSKNKQLAFEIQLPIKSQIRQSIKMLDSLINNAHPIFQPKGETNLTIKQHQQEHSQPPLSKEVYNYSKRSLLNILLIILCTFEVVLITNSKFYIDSSLVRSFLSFYVDQSVYPEIFYGNAYYIYIQDVADLQRNMQYMLQKMGNSTIETINNLNFSSANITLQIQYHPNIQRNENTSSYPINPDEGITTPFDLSNLTQIQFFLLKTHAFQIVVENLQIKNEGLQEKYIHRVIYHYNENSEVSVNFDFKIDNVISNTIDYDKPQRYQLLYLRVFYFIIIIVALLNFYFHIVYVRRAFKEFYIYLQSRRRKRPILKRRQSIFKQLNESQVKQIDKNIFMYVQSGSIDINNLRWKDYLKVIQFQILFGILASSLQIISNFSLMFGRQHDEVIGLSCLFAWMTLFRTLQSYKKLTLMYELIKLSILRLIEFSASFFLIFMGFVMFGTTVFPKARFFASMSYSVTTLFSMMAGDSIDMITMEIRSKYSSLLAICYIFSYVIMFMHAIHNTLTSIIKEYFILRKIQLIYEQKQKLGQHNYVYIEEVPIEAEKKKNQLPLKLTFSLQRDLLRIKSSQNLKQFDRSIRILVAKMESIFLHEKIESMDYCQRIKQEYFENLRNRLISFKKINENIFEMCNKNENEILQKKSIANSEL